MKDIYKCPNCGSDKVVSPYGIPGIWDKCTICGSCFQLEDDEMEEGAEKYFDRTLQIGLTDAPLMLTGGNDSTPADNGELF